MLRLFCCAVVVLWTSLCVGSAEEGPPLEKFPYVEDFEEKDPVEFWASNGKYRANFKGITEEKALTGKKSFKLDLTLESGSFNYWAVSLAPPGVAAVDDLRVSGLIYVEQLPTGADLTVGLGYDFVFPPGEASGCWGFSSVGNASRDWTYHSSGSIAEAGRRMATTVFRYGPDRVVYLDKWYLEILGKFSGQRVVIYLDDIMVADKETTEAHKAEVVKPSLEKQKLQQLQIGISRGESLVRSLHTTPQEMATVTRRIQSIRKRVNELVARASAGRPPSEEEETSIRLDLGKVMARASVLDHLARLPKRIEGVPAEYVPFILPAITNERLLPHRMSASAKAGTVLSLVACPDEYEPATFAIYALQGLKGVQVAVSPLVPASDGPAPAPSSLPSIDVRAVKCWYQAGVILCDIRVKQKLLTPELLLKDDDLVRVDYEKQETLLKVTDSSGNLRHVSITTPDSSHLADVQVEEAPTLQPLDIPADSFKQFWLTLHAPPEATPGDYWGTVRIQVKNTPTAKLTLTVKILPFKLEPALLTYSIYYRGLLHQKGTISSDIKSAEQYLAEMQNMKAHGVLYPTEYYPYSEPALKQILELRKQAGLPGGVYFCVGRGTGSPSSEAELEKLMADVKMWRQLLAQFGYHQVYFYGIDEVSGEELKAERPAWKAVHDAGGEVFVACSRGAFELVGDLLDVAVFSGYPDPGEARKCHNFGHRIFSYNNPQVGVEEPETYRRNFGLLLWKSRFDGAMDYAYQHAFGHIWNDYDTSMRDHVFAYPTRTGVIDTVQWEGFREGVDDVRYVTTLERATERAPAVKKEIAKQARKWLDALDPQTADLSVTRAKMVKWILRLKK